MKEYKDPEIRFLQTELFERIAATCWDGYAGNTIAFVPGTLNPTIDPTSIPYNIPEMTSGSCSTGLTGTIQTYLDLGWNFADADTNSNDVRERHTDDFIATLNVNSTVSGGSIDPGFS